MEECLPAQRGVKIKSNSQYLVWPPAALSTAVHLLMDCTRFARSCCEMLPHSSTKAPASSRTFLGRMALALTLRSNRSQTCSMGSEIRALRWPWRNTDIPVLQEIMHRTSTMAGGIVMLEGHVRMCLQEGYHMREEDVFPVTHSVEIACTDNKLSPIVAVTHHPRP